WFAVGGFAVGGFAVGGLPWPDRYPTRALAPPPRDGSLRLRRCMGQRALGERSGDRIASIPGRPCLLATIWQLFWQPRRQQKKSNQERSCPAEPLRARHTACVAPRDRARCPINSVACLSQEPEGATTDAAPNLAVMSSDAGVPRRW